MFPQTYSSLYQPVMPVAGIDNYIMGADLTVAAAANASPNTQPVVVTVPFTQSSLLEGPGVVTFDDDFNIIPLCSGVFTFDLTIAVKSAVGDGTSQLIDAVAMLVKNFISLAEPGITLDQASIREYTAGNAPAGNSIVGNIYKGLVLRFTGYLNTNDVITIRFLNFSAADVVVLNDFSYLHVGKII